MHKDGIMDLSCHTIMSSFFGCFLYAYMLSKDVLQSAHANVRAKCCEKLAFMHMEDKMVEKTSARGIHRVSDVQP